MMLKPVLQEEKTGCAIASAALLAGVSYQTARKVAASLELFAGDCALWTETGPIRRLLENLGVSIEACEREFSGWDALPDCALLAIKWQPKKGRPAWHWVVFRRVGGRGYVLDSKKSLRSNVRRDFGRIRPKWFIAVRSESPARDCTGKASPR